MATSNHYKNLLKLTQRLCNRHDRWQAFADFVALTAISISNSVDLKSRDEREQRYLQILKRYNAAECALFPQMFAELVMALEGGADDVLGRLFGELEIGNSARGQYFTPYSVSEVTARMIVGDGTEITETINRKGFVRLNEPACGAGAMVIAFASAMQNAGINYQQRLHVVAQDIDERAVHMAYVQFSLLHIPATVVLGNTLTMEFTAQWFTPAHVLGNWSARLRTERMLDAFKQLLDSVVPADSSNATRPPETVKVPRDLVAALPDKGPSAGQISLF